LPRQGNGVDGAEWLAARPRLTARASTQALRAREGPLGKRGRRKGAGGNTLPPMRARIGRSRSCSRVVECRCRSRQQMSWRKEADASTSTDLESSGDGRLAPGRPRASVNDREQRDIGAESTRKQSRDRARDRPFPRVRRGEAGDGRHLRPPMWAARHGAPTDAALAASWVTRSRERSRARAKRQGCQRLGWFGNAWQRTPRANPDRPPKRMGAS
jgi:hypothetical protein